MKISGEFDVKLNPIEGYAEGKEGIRLNRMSIEKPFTENLKQQAKERC